MKGLSEVKLRARGMRVEKISALEKCPALSHLPPIENPTI